MRRCRLELVGVPAERDRIHGTRKQGSPGQRDRRGLCARDFVHTRWRVNSLPIPHPSLAIPPNNHLLQRSCKHNAVPLPSSCSQSPLGQWGEPPHPTTTTTILLPLPDPQTDTSFIEILWCSNPQLPPGAIMDSLRQPFPARLSSKPAWVTSPPLLLEKSAPAVSFLSHPAHLQAVQAAMPSTWRAHSC